MAFTTQPSAPLLPPRVTRHGDVLFFLFLCLHCTSFLRMPHVFLPVLWCFCGSVTAPLTGLAYILQRFQWFCVDAHIFGNGPKTFLKQKRFHFRVDIALVTLSFHFGLGNIVTRYTVH